MIEDLDQQLIIDIRADPSAFRIVFDRYYQPVFGYIFRRVADYDVSCDIVSETFMKAFIHIHKFEWKGIPLSYWLYRIATNEIRLYFRRNKYVPESLSFLIDNRGWDLVDPKSTPEEKLALEKEISLHRNFLVIQMKMKTLPIKYQEVLALKYFEQRTIHEISRILGKNENTVKSLLTRGLENLRRML